MKRKRQTKTLQNYFRRVCHWMNPQRLFNAFLLPTATRMKTRCLWVALILLLKGNTNCVKLLLSGNVKVSRFVTNFRYEVIQPPVADLFPRPKVLRGQPLSEVEWQTYFDDEGMIQNSEEIRRKIFSGVNETA